MKFLSGTSRFFPSKRVGALLLIVGAVIVATVIFRHEGRTETPTAVTATLTVERQNVNEVDTDGDGVRDWEEALWGLSLVNPDSDGDGVDDSGEIAEEHARQEEQQQNLLAQISGTLEGGDENLTKTERLAQTILEQAFLFEDSGIALDADTADMLAANLTGILGSPRPLPPSILMSALTVVEETPETLRSYGNALGAALLGTQTDTTSELVVLTSFGQSGNPEDLSKLIAVGETYDTIIAILLRTPVPGGLAEAHLAYVNALTATRESLTDLSKLASDPLEGIVGLQAYSSYSKAMVEQFTVLQTYLRTHVSFGVNEPGYTLVSERT